LDLTPRYPLTRFAVIALIPPERQASRTSVLGRAPSANIDNIISAAFWRLLLSAGTSDSSESSAILNAKDVP